MKTNQTINFGLKELKENIWNIKRLNENFFPKKFKNTKLLYYTKLLIILIIILYYYLLP